MTFFFLFERGGLDSTLWKVNTRWVEQVNVLRFHSWRLGPLSHIYTLTDFHSHLQPLFQGFSHLTSCCFCAPSLFLLSSLCVSYLLGCDHHQLFSMGESLLGYLLGIYAFTHIKCLFCVPICVWMPVFAPSYLKDCLPVLDSSPFGVCTPSSLALSTSTSFVHFIFHACSFTRLAAHCFDLLITHLSLRPPRPACSCSLVSDQYKWRLLRYTAWYFWSNTHAFRL